MPDRTRCAQQLCVTSNSSELSGESGVFGLPNRYGVLLVVLLTAVSLMPIWVTEYFPSQNGPWYLLQVHMMHDYDNPTFDYPDNFEVRWRFIPHILHNLLVYWLSFSLPLLIAEKVALSLYVILLPLSIFYFLSKVASNRTILGFMAFLIIHCYIFYRGYHNNSLSLPLLFFAFGYWHQHRERASWTSTFVMALLTFLTCMAHIFSFLFLVCAIGYYRLIERRSLGPAVVTTLWATWPGWLVLVDHWFLVRSGSTWVDPEDTSFLLPHTALEYLVRRMFYTISFPAYIVSVLPWLFIVYLLIRRIPELKRDEGGLWRSFSRDPMLVMMVTVTVFYFFVPYKVIGWHHVNERLIPYIYVMAIASAAPLPQAPYGRHLRAALLAVICVAVVAVNCLLSLKVVQMHRDIKEYISGIHAYNGNCALLPVLAENEPYGQIRPATRCYEYYHIAKGGVNGYGIANTASTNVYVIYRHYPVSDVLPRFDPESPDASMDRIKETYTYVLLWGRHDDWTKRLGAAGFRQVFKNGRLRLFRNEDAPVSSVAEQSQSP